MAAAPSPRPRAPLTVDGIDVEMRLIDPALDRRRVWAVTTTRGLFASFVLVIVWGRLGAKLRRREEHFANEDDLTRRRRALLRTRVRHGYVRV